MAFSRDEILKAWDEALSEVDNPSDAEIRAASAVICAKCAGVNPDDIRDALRASLEELKGELSSADRTLRVFKALASEGKLPGLPGGLPLQL